mmetsp:Transcript_19642/g.61541  ORF Transcript_19642/g.61541 Transcript_19642/m.61541 type:complete len:133 (+) Transcript_19642:898-1296(+)
MDAMPRWLLDSVADPAAFLAAYGWYILIAGVVYVAYGRPALDEARGRRALRAANDPRRVESLDGKRAAAVAARQRQLDEDVAARPPAPAPKPAARPKPQRAPVVTASPLMGHAGGGGGGYQPRRRRPPGGGG